MAGAGGVVAGFGAYYVYVRGSSFGEGQMGSPLMGSLQI